MSNTQTNDNRLSFVALGGAGEIGMNMYLYGYGVKGKERYILVDIGVAFPRMDQTPGVDLIMADFSFIQERADRLDGIFITHGHEDHLGALPSISHLLGAPIYGRRFTATLAQLKLDSNDNKWQGKGKKGLVREVKAYPAFVQCGDMKVSFLPISHSIPESSALMIETPNERIVHSGDFKIDKTPVMGDAFNEDLFNKIGDLGVDALMCDSTNVFSNHAGRSEATLAPAFDDLFGKESGLIVATTFASNVARLKTLAQAGVRAGRKIVVMGHSMRRMLGAARTAGVLGDFPTVMEWEDATGIARNKLLVLITGSQGERRAGSAKLAGGNHLGLSMNKGDVFVFSSKTIPGNELEVGRIINEFMQQGVKIIDDTSNKYHVSGHANAPDLQAFHKMIRPKMLIPMHGEYAHLVQHTAMAIAGGMTSVVAPNGTVVDLSGDTPAIVNHIKTGRTYLDGSLLVGAKSGIVRERLQVAISGLIMVFVIMEGKEIIDVWAEPVGMPMDSDDLGEAIEEAILDEVKGGKVARMDDDGIEQAMKRTTQRTCYHQVGKKPMIRVMINRLD